MREVAAADRISPNRIQPHPIGPGSDQLLNPPKMPRGKPTASTDLDWSLRRQKPANDPLFGRHFAVLPGKKCSQCGNMRTPTWRSGPQGYRTLCNACGVQWLYHFNPASLEGARQSGRRINKRHSRPWEESDDDE